MKKVFIFLAGAALGSVVTYKVTERYFNKLIDQEIESVKETFKERLAKIEETEKNIKDDTNIINENNEVINIVDPKGSIGDKGVLEEIVKDLGYAVGVDTAEKGTESKQVEETIDEEDDSDYVVPVEVGKEHVPPYVISETEFGEFGNEEETLMFFADGKLTDEGEELIVDPENVVGNALKEFENDPYLERVYVRDENIEKDYIILRSEKTYQEVYGEEE